MPQKRNSTFDNVRAICVFWIVGIWHILEYGFSPIEKVPYGGEITLATLTLFTFMSGFFLKRKPICNTHDVLVFYKNRFWRLYPPLFLIGILLWGINWYDSILQFFGMLTGLSFFCQPNVKTLWYISMLLLFYFLTPIVLWQKKRKERLMTACFIFILFYLLSLITHIDNRVILFSLIYFGSLCLEDEFPELLSKQPLRTFGICATLIIPYLLLPIDFTDSLSYFCKIPMILGICGVVYVISTFISYNHQLTRILSKISYSSMLAYMSHRLFYVLFWHLTLNITYKEYSFIFIIPIIFYFSYLGQKFYDYLILKLKYK